MATMTRVQLRNGFDHVIITLDHSREDLPEFVTDDAGQPVAVKMIESDVYRVTGTGLYATSHGFVAGDTREFSFGDVDEAKAKANGWFAGLVRKGYERIQ
jgi:hypothetical protein